MAKFKNIDAAEVALNEALREYLCNAGTIGSANRGGTFVGNRDIAPDALRAYGIVLPKGGMILPDQEPAEIQAVLDEWRSQERATAAQAALAQWEGDKEKILPVLEGLKNRLLHAAAEQDNGNTKAIVYLSEISRPPAGWSFSRGPGGGGCRWLHIPVPYTVFEEILRRWKAEGEEAARREAEASDARKREWHESAMRNKEGLEALRVRLSEEGIARLETRSNDLVVCVETADGEVELRLSLYADPQDVETRIVGVRDLVVRIQAARARYYPRVAGLLRRAKELDDKHYGRLLVPVEAGARVAPETGAFSVGIAMTKDGGVSSYGQVVSWDDPAVEARLDSWERKIVALEREFEELIALIPTDCGGEGVFVWHDTSPWGTRPAIYLCATFGGPRRASSNLIAERFVATAKSRGGVDYAEHPEEFLRRCEVLGFTPVEERSQRWGQQTHSWSESPDGYRPAGTAVHSGWIPTFERRILGGRLEYKEGRINNPRTTEYLSRS